MYTSYRFSYFISIALSLSFISGEGNRGDTSKQPTFEIREITRPNIQVASLTPKVRSATSGDTLINIKKATVDGIRFTVFSTESGDLYMKDNIGNVKKLDIDNFPGSFEFKDFDGDGFKDIQVYYLTNIPGIQDVFLYDKSLKNFRPVADIEYFPVPIRIPHTRFYYSYQRSGCADMDWNSDLFIIKNYKAVRIGNIGGYDCEDSGIEDGLYIYRVIGEKKTLIERHPIEIINNYRDNKWGFIKSYWTKNYKAFK